MDTPKEFVALKWSNGNPEDHCMDDVYNIMSDYAEEVLAEYKSKSNKAIDPTRKAGRLMPDVIWR